MKAINKPFTITDILRFTHYYSHNRIKQYLFILRQMEFIIESGVSKRKQPTFIISDKGIQVIQELNNSYEKELYLFCDKYNVVL